MNAHELFRAWAPDDAHWTPWVKPVLFASAGTPPDGDARARWSAELARERTWTPPRPADLALVLDLPGPQALALALDCAARGWRPVPLFNSCRGRAALVDNEPLVAGLEDGQRVLAGLALRDDAPPAFVLDARRLDGVPASSSFDNRWIVFPQDLPSAARLAACRIARVLLVQTGRREPRNDLAHVLLRWQQAGIEILGLDLAALDAGGKPGEPEPLRVKKPGLFRALGYRVLTAVGLRPSSAGGFGAIVPLAHAGGHGGFA
jgi:hypothetical protein